MEIEMIMQNKRIVENIKNIFLLQNKLLNMDIIAPKGNSTGSAKTTPKHIAKKYRKKCNPACSSRFLGFWRCRGETTCDNTHNKTSLLML